MPPKIELRNICKRFETGRALHDISFSIQAGEKVALLGPSGAGKSLILRLIAGTEKPTSGTVFIDGRAMNALHRFLSPARRGTGLVTQDMPLHPHRSVLATIRSGFTGKKIAKDDRDRFIQQMLLRLDVAGLERKLPHQISGGERGRFALIRALAPGNRILLLDEPFSGLDPHQRADMVKLIAELHREMNLTTVYVSHYVEEAQTLCDHVAVLNRGRLIQQGTWIDIRYKPADSFVREHLSVSTRFNVPREILDTKNSLG